MDFDVQAAKKAGYTDREIADYLTAPAPVETPSKASMGEDVPKWGRKSPTAYAAAMTAMDMSPALAAFVGPLAGIPLAGAINAAAQSLKRKLHGDETSGEQVATDAVVGAVTEGAGRGVAKGVSLLNKIPAVNEIAKKLYGSAMKFSTSPNVLSPSERSVIAETGLKNKFLPDEESWLRFRNMVSTNRNKVDDIYDAGTKAGDMIQPGPVLRSGDLRSLLDYGKDVQRVTPGYTDEVKKQLVNFVKEGAASPNSMNAAKRQLQLELEGSYGNNTLSTASSQTKKQLASGLRQVLDDTYLEAGAINANSHELLNLGDHLARSIGRVNNRDIVGLGDKIIMDAISNIPKEGGRIAPTMFGTIMSVIDRPIPKAKMAIAMYKDQTGKTLPLSQWRKAVTYFNTPQVRGAYDAAVLGMANANGGGE